MKGKLLCAKAHISIFSMKGHNVQNLFFET